MPLLVILALLAILFWQRERLLSSAGLFLDISQAPRKADAILVLAGGWQGERILKAGALARAGLAPVVYVSGPRSYYERPECDYAIPFAAEHGYPREWFRCVANNARSTREEAAAVLPELYRLGVRSCILVSVRTHLRRARYLCGQARPPGLELQYVGAEDRNFQLGEWYKSREGKKAVLLEWLKIAALPFED